jgi:predicted ATPase/DNA-binding XRE family transcriptional regulator
VEECTEGDRAPSVSGRERGATFGVELRRLRQAAGLTQEELAASAGLTAKAVSVLERGERKRPYPHTVRSLADALGLSEGERASLLAAVPGRGGATPAVSDTAAPVFAPPMPLTRLVGREREVGEIDRLLGEDAVRLLTLSGPGGIGKTSLGIEAARRAAGRYPGGVAFVALAPLGDASLVMPTISQTLGLREEAGVHPLEALSRHLRDKTFLLLLDNFEHVVGAAPEVADMLGSCPGLRVLATSRASLRVRGEREYPVSPLAVPDPTRSPGAEEVGATPAVELFVGRAKAASPSFGLTKANAAAVAAICWRLDGLPLALELAAAQARFLGPTALLARLDRALEAEGARDLPERQRTMRNTIDWSRDLLSEPEKELFERLSVFAGGFSLEAAEEVGDVQDAFALLGNLVEQSLVVAEASSEGWMRYRMLEPIRQYAAGRLAQTGEEWEVRRKHALWYTRFAEEAEEQLAGPEQGGWLDRLEAEHDNLRAALRWSLSGNDPEGGLRLAADLWRMWNARGYMQEGRDWLEKALASADDRPSTVRAKALNVAGAISYQQGDIAAARGLFEESIGVSRELGEEGYVSTVTCNLANVMLDLGEHARARELFEQCLIIDQRLGDKSRTAYSLGGLADVYYATGELDKAVDHYARSLVLHRELDDRRSVALTLHNLGEIALKRNDSERAEDLYKESLQMAREIDDRWLTVQILPGLASLFALRDHHQRALSVLAAADATRREIGFEFQADALADHDRTVELARAALPGDRYEAAWQKGSAMSLEEVTGYVLEGESAL